ncbi:DUF4192 domain-containing protein [Streptacidiphilus sp. ASG 303]|uniref:DUF4192 domain-containing protein n=1 Tax=Streptacidiphilus sp. ASG 303 TaxID=2896847 RepID=UPI001E36B0E3|nr:DUF4192 domain-containing protein [Streptacidiphilus sp. ASG 303]MCD0484652.1 DUF4192 domain-containing protein [Streptacidiphilus sp. ASG 303]
MSADENTSRNTDRDTDIGADTGTGTDRDTARNTGTDRDAGTGAAGSPGTPSGSAGGLPGAGPRPPGPSAGQPVVRMRGPADMAEMLPYLLGFHPDDSIVALGLQGPGLRQGGTVRVDIPRRPDWERVAADTARLLVRLSEAHDRRPRGVVLYLVRDPGPGRDGRAVADGLRPLAELLDTAFRGLGLDVKEALCVSDGRWWSYACRRPGCCDPDGTPVRAAGDAGPVAAAATYAGLTVRGSRRELRAAMEPVGPPEAQELAEAFARVAPVLAAEVGRPGGARQVGERTGALLDAAMERFRAGADRLDDEEAVRLVLGLQDKRTRDRAAEFAEPTDLAAARRLWLFLARRCVAPFQDHAAAPLTLLAWTAWLAGDTATTRVALARALDADPDYTLAQLLYDSLNGGLRPDRLLATVRRERARRLARRDGRSGPGGSAGRGRPGRPAAGAV